MFVTVFPATFFGKRRFVTGANTVLAIGLLASLYCVAAGLFLLTDWHDPLATADPALLGRVVARQRGKGGLILLAIRAWPYILIAFGGFFAYVTFLPLWRQRTLARDARERMWAYASQQTFPDRATSAECTCYCPSADDPRRGCSCRCHTAPA